MTRFSFSFFAAAVAALAVLMGCDTTATASAPGSAPTNRLAAEASPYLQLHRHNPVDWYPWGDEAFERARAEDKPIFLSVGYSTCYWCHVMEREVFSNPEIAALMNELFINIKVDREERPDIDEIYMTATQLLTGSGGWPNSVFLTPNGEPFYAGTYFPAEDSGNRPGFPRVLRQLTDAWNNRRDEVIQRAAAVRSQIEATMSAVVPANESHDPAAVLTRAVSQLERSYEPRHGGFSTRTKFPSPPKLEVLLAAHRIDANPRALEMLTLTLDEMALGGIYDHLAGGFHRYSTEPTWSIPHYEKMLYDNAQLLGLYARAYEITKRPLYRQVAIDLVNYLEREMRHPEGGFYSAQDAEVDGHEGASYLWTREEIASTLGVARAVELLSVYQLVAMPEATGAALRVTLPLDLALKKHKANHAAELLEAFEKDRAALLKVRSKRKQPLRDDKVLAAWNGLTIRALVDAARALKRPEYLDLAESAARFVLERLAGPEGVLKRSYIAGQSREAGVLEDYAYLADGLLALYEANGESHWLVKARELADRMLANFEDKNGGGFFLTVESSELFARPRRIYDNVEPSGSGVALRVLLALAAQTGEARYIDAADRTQQAFGGAFGRSPASVGTAVVAMVRAPSAPTQIAKTPPQRTRPDRTAPDKTRPSAASDIPESGDFVEIGVRHDEEGSGLVVSVAIQKGWHINANPASFPFLIPTTVKVEGRDTNTVARYPEGKAFAPTFSADAISTYRGTVEIPVQFEQAHTDADSATRPAPAKIAVRYQACDDTRCLAPSVSRAPIP